ncbi:hypothetical protein DY000_02026830 [Brassica cretica]|uniref:UDP-N-acetylglucosamine transferase subunit ALG14 n=1 Tax=Brassica cretica TaxID=69181 RepID=A0ABQ7E2G2_BRACR|nr:hypothetical protein DY000_02026830 [Brassica cretica]
MEEEHHHCCIYSKMLSKCTFGSLVIVLSIFLMVRVVYRCGKPFPKGASPSFTTLIVLGSGGHTAEMLSLLSVLRMDRYTPRFYIAAATDNMSLQKARSFEHSLPDKLLAKKKKKHLKQLLGIRWSSIFYVESVARVKKLSLSGLLLYNLRMADQFFVQWPQLQKNYPRAHYVRCLM